MLYIDVKKFPILGLGLFSQKGGGEKKHVYGVMIFCQFSEAISLLALIIVERR